MIAESPAPSCTKAAPALRRRQMAAARAGVRVCNRARVTGVAFLDVNHGQTGVAANAIGLHPILGFRCLRSDRSEAVLIAASPLPPSQWPSSRAESPAKQVRSRLRTRTARTDAEYRHGVGKVGATDHTSGKPVTTFLRSKRLYAVAMQNNRGLDRDKDGIACETA